MHPRNMSDEELLKNVLITKEKIPESVQELASRFIVLLEEKFKYEHQKDRIEKLEKEILDLENPNY